MKNKSVSRVKNTHQIYCYLRLDNFRYLLSFAKKNDMTQSKALNLILKRMRDEEKICK